MGDTCGTSSTTNAGACNSYPIIEQEAEYCIEILANAESYKLIRSEKKKSIIEKDAKTICCYSHHVKSLFNSFFIKKKKCYEQNGCRQLNILFRVKTLEIHWKIM